MLLPLGNLRRGLRLDEPAAVICGDGALGRIIASNGDASMGGHDTGDINGLVRWSAVGGIVGTVSFFFLILVIGVTHDGYSALSDEISQLGAAGVSGHGRRQPTSSLLD